ncbi:unnamed protein product, partial [marine sediment metagenome]
SIIEKKGIWTIGYNVDFQFMINAEFPVEEDPVAEPFGDVTVAIIKAILDGKKLKEVRLLRFLLLDAILFYGRCQLLMLRQ